MNLRFHQNMCLLRNLLVTRHSFCSSYISILFIILLSVFLISYFPDLGGEPPRVIEPLKDTSAGLKETVSLICKISGNPTPTVKWYEE